MTSPTRRDVLRVGGGALAVGAGASALVASPAHAAVAAPGSGAAFVPDDLALHLVRRTTFGPTPALVAQVRRLGRDRWLEGQLMPATIDDTYCQELVASRFPRLQWTIAETVSNLQPLTGELMQELAAATIVRAAWSKRQLFEVMCEFWSNHLHVTAPHDDIWESRHDYERRVIRSHAFGRFEDMLVASAQHPAMLNYLNNVDSTRTTLNENYGRELLELHTVGVDAGYTEEDMYHSALVMTGFGVDRHTSVFRFEPADHWVGPVRVMGFTDPNASAAQGFDVGVRYLRYLARHPQTARHLATKLCRRFISDRSHPKLVDALAKTYLANGTAIRPVLRQLFASTTFGSSAGLKVRRPFEDLVATMRILGCGPDVTGWEGIRRLYWVADQMGQAPFAWGPPNGYPDDAVSWQSAAGTLAAWNTHRRLAEHRWPVEIVGPDLASMLPNPLPGTHGGLVDAVARRLVFRTMSPTHTNAVLGFFGVAATTPLTSGSKILERLGELVSLILDSPYHAVR